MARIAQRKDPFLGARGFLVTARAADRGVESVAFERLLQSLRLHHARMHGRTRADRINARSQSLLIDMHDQLKPERMCRAVAESDHIAKFPCRIDMEERERQPARVECLARDVQHHARILADRIEHHRTPECGGHLAHDADQLSFKLAQMRRQGTRDHRALHLEKTMVAVLHVIRALEKRRRRHARSTRQGPSLPCTALVSRLTAHKPCRRLSPTKVAWSLQSAMVLGDCAVSPMSDVLCVCSNLNPAPVAALRGAGRFFRETRDHEQNLKSTDLSYAANLANDTLMVCVA